MQKGLPMPAMRRCKFFNANGTPIKSGRHRHGCPFVHPTDPGWASALPPYPAKPPDRENRGSGGKARTGTSWGAEFPVLTGANRAAQGPDAGRHSARKNQAPSDGASGGGDGWGAGDSWGSGDVSGPNDATSRQGVGEGWDRPGAPTSWGEAEWSGRENVSGGETGWGVGAADTLRKPEVPQLKPAWDWGKDSHGPSAGPAAHAAPREPQSAPSRPSEVPPPPPPDASQPPPPPLPPATQPAATSAPIAQKKMSETDAPITAVPLADVEIIKMVLRAARVRQERVEYGKQYDQWKMTQRSKWYSSIGMTARERLDQHASELKQARDLNEKTLTGLIDALSQTLENAQTLKLEPLLEETKRYLSEAKTWLESARPHLPPMPIPIPIPMPLQAQVQHGDVEMESGEISEEATPSVSSLKRRRKDDGHRDEWTTIQLARIEALQEKFDELEGETTQGLSVDVNALVERALATLRAREDTELGDPAESMEPTQFVKLQEQQERLDAQLRDGQSKKDALMAKMQVIDTDFASWKARCSQAELKCQEKATQLAELKESVERGNEHIAELTNTMKQLHHQRKPAPASSATPALVEDIYRALQLRMQDDLQGFSGLAREVAEERIRTCDERLFEALSSRLQPTMMLTDVLYHLAQGNGVSEGEEVMQ